MSEVAVMGERSYHQDRSLASLLWASWAPVPLTVMADTWKLYWLPFSSPVKEFSTEGKTKLLNNKYFSWVLKVLAKISTIINMLYIFCDCCSITVILAQRLEDSNRNQIILHLFSFIFPSLQKCILENSLRADAEYKIRAMKK